LENSATSVSSTQTVVIAMTNLSRHPHTNTPHQVLGIIIESHSYLIFWPNFALIFPSDVLYASKSC